MGTTTIHPPTGHGAPAGPPVSDPHQIISDLRHSLAADAAWQEVAERAQADALAVRNRLREVEAQRDQARQTVAAYRDRLAQSTLADRIRWHEEDLKAKVRALEDQLAVAASALAQRDRELAAARLVSRGRRWRWSR